MIGIHCIKIEVMKRNRWDFFIILVFVSSRVLQIHKASRIVDMDVGKLFKTIARAAYVTESIH